MASELGDGAGMRWSLALVGAALAIAAAVALVVSWVDIGVDATCGSVAEPTWWSGCEGTYALRGALAAALVVAAGADVVTTARRWRGAPHLAAAAALVGGTLLLWNEVVRSGGTLTA